MTADTRLPLSEIVREAVANSTAHAICRVAPASRSAALRLFWLLAFLGFLGLMLNSCVAYVARLNSPKVQSEFQAEKVRFEFPDVYFCNSLQAAGSFIYLLNKSEADQVNVPFSAAQAKFDQVLKSLNASESENSTFSEFKLLSSIQSLKYKLLADIVGQRKLQTFYGNFGIFTAGSESLLRSPVAVETLYHPNHLKCFKLALTPTELAKMQDTNSRLKLNLLLDPHFYQFDILGFMSPGDSRLPNSMVLISGHPTYIYPFDWDLENPLGFDRGSGMYLYLTSRGQYPSRLTSTVISLAPGRAYDLAISMRDAQMTPEDFPNQCIDQHDPALFLNPYSGSADAFSYSEAHCYYSEIARDMQQRYNCSPKPDPTPWQFRHLALCLNLTAAGTVENIHRNMKAAVKARLDADSGNNTWDQACAGKRLCRRRTYSVTSSFGLWPNQASLIRLVDNILRSLLDGVYRADFRSLDTAVRTMNYADRNNVISLEDGISRYFQRAAVSVTLRAEATHSSLTTFRLDYRLTQFIADIGSALGLYLGCSLLTVFELFELLHDVLTLSNCLKLTAKN